VHGRTAAERARLAAEKARAEERLEGHRLEKKPDGGDER
jgi:hypothetical protein